MAEETIYDGKIIFYGQVLMDLTGDTVNEDNLLSGATAHGANGAPVAGACTYDADTSDGTITAADVLSGGIGYSHGQKVVGTMPDRSGSDDGTISTVNGTVQIQQGFHDGAGTVGIDPIEKAKLIPGNIKAGVTILDVEGTHEGSEDVNIQASKTATPATTQQTILPDTGYDALGQVVVSAIPVTRVLNASGGYTVTIG